jgi:hypothetical protein
MLMRPGVLLVVVALAMPTNHKELGAMSPRMGSSFRHQDWLASRRNHIAGGVVPLHNLKGVC